MATGFDSHKEALDVILVGDADAPLGNSSVRFIQGFTRATCVIAILTCAIHVLTADPGLAHNTQSAVLILESCLAIMCNYRAVDPVEEYYEMLRLPDVFTCRVLGCAASFG